MFADAVVSNVTPFELYLNISTNQSRIPLHPESTETSLTAMVAVTSLIQSPCVSQQMLSTM